MKDQRIEKLAHNLVTFSCDVKPGENLLVEGYGDCDELIRAIVRETYAAGGRPFVWLRDQRIRRELLMNCDAEQLRLMGESDASFMRQMQAYIGVRGTPNPLELSDVPHPCLTLFEREYSSRVHRKIRVPQTKWSVLRYPSEGMALMAGMSSEAFEDHFFNVCCLDYSAMDAAMTPLKALMEQTDVVRLKGPGTDLTFSIKGMPAIKCSGRMNIPDGEIYTAPVCGTMNGVISYNTRSVLEGFSYENIVLSFRDGRIVDATANDTARINDILGRDEGARGVGEFALGVNPLIKAPIGDTLFDEKIAGSFHLTPGCCYDECDNGNKSDIHWDLVCIQTPEMGGGEIWFDGVLVRENGRFVPDELQCLNPENLV